MARKIHSRLKIEGVLTALTPLHVGGHGDSTDTDLSLARNGEYKWYAPGTSLAGVLRAWCVKAFGENLVDDLWGFQKDDKGHASFVVVEDAVVGLPTGAVTEIRDGVGIDRAWGVAAEGIKYDRAILPRGSTLNLKMTVDLSADKADQSKAVIGHLLDALSKGEIHLGAARTRGLGRVEFQFDKEKSVCQVLSTRTGILQVLKSGGDKIEPEKWKETIKPDKRPRLEIAIKWHPRSSLMVKAGYDGIGVDMLPLVSAKDGGVALTLPGSAIKGSLRNHAERIVRTLLDKGAPRDASDRQNFMSQLELPLIDELFGARGRKEKTHKGLGALSVADCYAVEVMNREAWAKVEQAKADPQESSEKWDLRQFTDPTSPLPDPDQAIQFDTVKQQRFEVRHNVAIDRWTGGAAEGALFSVLAPTKTMWENISLMLDLKRLPEMEILPGVMLLLLTLHDLASNRLPLGFATNRGMGEVIIEKINLQGYDLDDDLLKALTNVELSEGKMSCLDQGLRDKLKGAWESWIETSKKEKPA